VNQLQAELLKLRTTRTTIGMLLGAIALTLLFTLLGGLLSGRDELARQSNQLTILGAHAPAILFASLVGVMLVTTEYRYGTIRPTLLYEPRRIHLLAAKLAAALLGGAVLAAIAEALALGIGLLILHERDVPVAYSTGGLVHVALGAVAVGALWCAIGAGLGAVVRHQVGAIIGLLAWLLVAENILFGLAPSVGRYAPGPAGQALAGDTASHLVSAAAGGVLLVAWTLGIAAVGAAVAARRDVD
jgi:ABC-type transport system involved in multi-copper enzyme maturation permease subunit